jgi:hypothetical protein
VPATLEPRQSRAHPQAAEGGDASKGEAMKTKRYTLAQAIDVLIEGRA